MTDEPGNTPREQSVPLTAADGRHIRLRIWRPAGEARGVLQILHGLSEHAARYARFARACNEHGIAVGAHDHRGHGEPEGNHIAGHFADSDGMRQVLDDVASCDTELRRHFPSRPLVLLGHSMGSYIAQHYAMERKPAIAGLALSGSTWPNRGEVNTARRLATILRFLRGTRTPSRVFDWLAFRQFNQAFKPNRTAFDWLSRDPDEVDRYVSDPLCGARATYGLWLELFRTLLAISEPGALERIPADLPLLITGGEMDPVGGKAPLTALAGAYRDSGHTDVTLKLYEDGRHEMLNEVNRDEVTADWLQWIERVIVADSTTSDTPRAWR